MKKLKFLLMIFFNTHSLAIVYHRLKKKECLSLSGTYELAKGIQSISNAEAVINQVKPSSNPKLISLAVASADELPSYDGIVFGFPVYFGKISSAISELIQPCT